ncbi:MAG: hypothetical protein RJQ01_05970 [Microcella sp.]|uniref:hypothetical protein n=1 Tax=Microcella sp. TaxID=1913979 RepID=UPI003316115D
MSHFSAGLQHARRDRGARAGRAALLGLAGICIAAQGLVLGGAAWAVANPRLVDDQLTVWSYEPDPAIVEYADRAGLSDEGRFLLYASVPEILPPERFDLFCSFEETGLGVLGCYTLADGRIFLYDVTNDELDGYEVVVAAHEMLHAAWDRLSVDARDALAVLLEADFAALGPEHELVERIAEYEALDPSSRIPELYAILGTEVPALAPALEEHYARYFDDRSLTTELYAQVAAVFDGLEERLQNLSDELDARFAALEADQAAYAAAAAALERDIGAFNDRASRPGGYTSQSAFQADRQALVDRQSALEAERESLNAAVDEYNALLDELEELNAEAAELNRSINVDAEPLPPSQGTDDDLAD